MDSPMSEKVIAEETERPSNAECGGTVPQLQISDGPAYRLYKRRFIGLFGFVVLGIVSAMGWPWFGPISNNMVAEFGITLDEVNWLGNIVAIVYLPVAILIPSVCARWGLRRCCEIGAVCLLIAAWVRYSSTATGLSPSSAYALLIIGQFFAGIAQPVFQILGPYFSEKWFDLRGRTTATMVIAIANPVGGALGQLIAPLTSSSRQSILILGIISTAAVPFVFLIGNAPPIPPTHAGSTPSQSVFPLIRALIGQEKQTESRMSTRERIDFAIISVIFGALVGAVNTWGILTAQFLVPHGYTDDISGLMGATLLLSGVVAAIITAPLFDRVFTHHLALTARCLSPLIAAAWVSLIWAIRPNNTGALFAIMAIIGALSVTLLPAGLELGVEVTRNSESSAALLWFAGNLTCVVFILVDGALRASSTASPPLNMRNALIFTGVVVSVAVCSAFGLRGEQKRRNLDEQKNDEVRNLIL